MSQWPGVHLLIAWRLDTSEMHELQTRIMSYYISKSDIVGSTLQPCRHEHQNRQIGRCEEVLLGD